VYRRARHVWIWIQIRQDARLVGNAVRRNDVVRERIANVVGGVCRIHTSAQRIVDIGGTEVPGLLRDAGHGRGDIQPESLPEALIVAEDEPVIVNDRATESSTELALHEIWNAALVLRRAPLKEVACVEGCVAQVFKC